MTDRNAIMDLWRIPQNADLGDTLTIRVKRSCGHVERLSFDGVDDGDSYRMPQGEAQRLATLKRTACVSCEGSN